MPARRFVLLALAVGGVAGVVLTYPLVVHPASTILEDGTLDPFQFVWNVWWVREALVTLHTSPFYTRYLFYPDGISLLFHTFSASLGLLSIPLQLVLPGGVLAAHNVLVIAAPALIVLMTGLLAREITGDPWASLAAGLVAAINTAMAWFVPIIYLSSTYLMAAVLWAWWRMHRRRRPRDVALVLALLLALVFASQEYAMMTLALLAIDTTGRVLAPGPLGMPRAWWPGLVAAWGIAAIGLGALARFAMHNPANLLREGAVMYGSGFLTGFFTPSWSAATNPFRFWYVLYLGTAPLLLLLVTVWARDRRAVYWAAALVVALLMACGPYVELYQPVLNAPAGTPLPPTDHLAPGRVPGPYFFAMKLAPLMRHFRAAYRWVDAGQIALGVLVAIGLTALRRRLTRPIPRRAVTAAALVAIAVLGAIDVRGMRAPVQPAEIPDAYAILRDDPEPSAVLELPVGLTVALFANLASRYMFYQTSHRKFLLEGTVARLPPGRVPLLARRFTTFTELPFVKYVVIHRDLIENALPVARTQVAAVDEILRTEGSLIRRDGPLELYRLTTFRPETVR